MTLTPVMIRIKDDGSRDGDSGLGVVALERWFAY